VAVAAAGVLPGWRSAALLISLDDGASWQEAGPTAVPAVTGAVQTLPAPASPLLWDESGTFDVALLNEAMALQSATPDAVLAGANAALVGDELIQFREATPLGGSIYRLSGLLRGRRGTEWAIDAHEIGEPFVLVERDSLVFPDVPPGTGLVRVLAVGMADAQPPEQRLVQPGRALLPLSPAHVRALAQPNGDTEIGWVRRSRNGWRWLDGADAPLVEEAERYRLTLTPDAGQPCVAERAEPELIYSAADRAADRAAGATRVTVAICQLGSFGLSRPATIELLLN